MRKAKTLFLLIIQVGLIGMTLYFSYLVAKSKLSVDDAHALYGGELEYGYKSGGFLINYGPTGAIKQCGYSAIGKNLGITAAHCVEDAKVMYVGTGQFDPANVVQVDSAIAREGWINNKDRTSDFAVLKFQGDSDFTDFATVATPSAGCNYRVVAYGRTEDPSSAKLRKSALLCISNINAATFQIQGYNSGICFGDSGSPIYVNGTNQVVGVVVSIINSANPNEPCNINNEATAVRVDNNLTLINQFVQAEDPNVSIKPDTTSVTVAEEDIFGKLGLSFVHTLTQQEKESYLVIFLLVSAVALIIVMAYMIINASREKNKPKPATSIPYLGYGYGYPQPGY
jgi:V8-like Glu-specific endopeptidase